MECINEIYEKLNIHDHREDLIVYSIIMIYEPNASLNYNRIIK